MMVSLLFALVSPAAALQQQVPDGPVATPQMVRVWLNRDGPVEQGDKLRVYTRTAGDGYLWVLHVEPNGRVRVLFPLDPSDDNFVRAGQDYELRARSNREPIQVYDGQGAGTVFAALAPDPFRFTDLSFNGHWDYRAEAWRMSGDPEADLTALAGRASDGRFDYDVQRYIVENAIAYGGGDDWYEPSWYGPGYDGYGGVHVHVGFGYRPWGWYNPWYWDPFWDPWDPWWWYPTAYWGPCCFFRPAPFTPVFIGARTRGVVFVGSGGFGVGTRYTFKSPRDRFGIAPSPVGTRRRTVGGASGFAAASSPATAPSRRGVSGASPSGGRAVPQAAPTRRSAGGSTASSAPSSRPAATPGRRSTGSSAPAARPTPRPSTPSAPARRPSSSSGRRNESNFTPGVGTRLSDGSWRLPTPDRRSAPADQPAGLRRSNDAPTTSSLGGDVRRPGPSARPGAATTTAPRGLRVAGDAPAPTRTGAGGTVGRSGGRSITPSSGRSSTSRAAPSAPSRMAPASGATRRASPAAPTRSAGPARSTSRAPAARSAPRSAPRSTPQRRSAPARRNR